MDNRQLQKDYDRGGILLLFVTISILLLTTGIMIAIVLRRHPHYYATSMDGILTPLYPLNDVQSFTQLL